MASFPSSSATCSMLNPQRQNDSDQNTIRREPARAIKEGLNNYNMGDFKSETSSDYYYSADKLKTLSHYASSLFVSEELMAGLPGNNLKTEKSRSIGNEESKSPTSTDPRQDLQEVPAQINIASAFSQLIENVKICASSSGVEKKENTENIPEESKIFLEEEKKDCLMNCDSCIRAYPELGSLYVMKARALYLFKDYQEAYELCNQIISKEASFQMLYQLIYFNPPSDVKLNFGYKIYSIRKWRFCDCCQYKFDYLNDTHYVCMYCPKLLCEGCSKRKPPNQELCHHYITYVMKKSHDTSQNNLTIGKWENFSKKILKKGQKLSNNLQFEPENACAACHSKSSDIWYQCAYCPKVSFCVECQQMNDFYTNYTNSSALKHKHNASHMMIKIVIPQFK